jgi:hypothetical protein
MHWPCTVGWTSAQLDHELRKDTRIHVAGHLQIHYGVLVVHYDGVRG